MRRREQLQGPRSPLQRATSITPTLPSFNFIEQKQPPRRRLFSSSPSTPTAPSLPRLTQAKPPPSSRDLPPSNHHAFIDHDAVVFQTLQQYATVLPDPTLSDESKAGRLWHGMQRQSEAGRFRGDAASNYVPNRVCTALALQLVGELLRLSGASLMLSNLLTGVLGNAIYLDYDPDKPARELVQYAEHARDMKTQLNSTQAILSAQSETLASVQTVLGSVKLDAEVGQDPVRLVTAIYGSLDPAVRSTTLIKTLQPYLDGETMVLLWNATAETIASKATPAPRQSDGIQQDAEQVMELERSRAANQASRMLQERVHLVLQLWEALSTDEQRIVYGEMDPAQHEASDGQKPLQGVLQTLQEMYLSEQRLLSTRRPTMLSNLGSFYGSSNGRSGKNTFSPRARSRTRLSMALIRPRASKQSVPDASMGALEEKPDEAAEEAQFLIEQLTNEQNELLKACEEVFEALCRDPLLVASDEPEQPQTERKADEDDDSAAYESVVNLAKHKLCDMLCLYGDSPAFIMEKFETSESRRAQRVAARKEAMEDEEDNDNDDSIQQQHFVQTLIQRQKQQPTLLVHAFNQSPEILISAIAQNNGILRFAITKFTPLVKRFLRLDLKACEYLDSLAMQFKGVQLLWGTPTTSASRSSSSESTSVQSSSAEAHLADWFAVHTTELSDILLKRPELFKQLFLVLYAQNDVSAFYRMMVQIGTTKGVQDYLRRSSVAALERLAQEDPTEIAQVLRDLFREGGNRDLLHQLQMSPYLATCLSELHPTAIHDVLSSDLETWKHYVMELVVGNDGILREVLLARTEQLEGSELLLHLFNAVVNGTVSALNLSEADLSGMTTPSDVARAKERDLSMRRKMLQCIFLRGGSTIFRTFLCPLIANVGFHPHTTCSPFQRIPALLPPPTPLGTGSSRLPTPPVPPSSPATGASSRSRAKKPTLKRRPLTRKKSEAAINDESENADAASMRTGLANGAAIPTMWQSFLQAFHRQRVGKPNPPTRGQLKTMILDIWIEFLKVDLLRQENSCLWTLAPFVCDYLITRYEAPAVVGEWLHSLLDGFDAFQSDPRVSFFAAVCGCGAFASEVSDMVGYDTFLYYAHALEHLLLGQMKIFKPANRLEQTLDGSCAIARQHVTTTAALLMDHRILPGADIDVFMHRLEELTAVPSRKKDENDYVELDDVMNILLDIWRLIQNNIDERYTQAFEFYAAGSHRIGREQFIKVVTSVTYHRISAREVLMVYCDVGEEFLDLSMLLRVSRAYQLRLFNAFLPEVVLPEDDMQELRHSLGRSNIFSIASEVEDLLRYWRGVRTEVLQQVEASHQTKKTKMHLKKQSTLIEKLLSEIQTTAGQDMATPVSDKPETLEKAWREIRICAKLLHTAKLTQQYLSQIYIQYSLVRWIRQARKRAARGSILKQRRSVRGEEEEPLVRI
ncbi:hypothetical protein Poli38472_000967 [Pythium oligandrum]|uniref:Uncharacterized protein n=1 Tax=Pythium oligandrum TaxID=41045 RepID=A0A8K1CD40_PYTOL|nr:hypothetical protein Poli38472_000967 [Pythium oligandrum]|eukprot:TMW60925.1 hypothetical protein Poli38472_000967 [Pythium oligandrum]